MGRQSATHHLPGRRRPARRRKAVDSVAASRLLHLLRGCSFVAVWRGLSPGPWLIITDFEDIGAQKLYEGIYCGRGRAELYIKDHMLGLVGDRLSCARREGNVMRLLCSSLACQELEGFRRESLAGTKLGKATFAEVRMKLLKLAARVRVMKTRVEVRLGSNHPGSSLVAQILGQALRVLAPRTASSAAGASG